jgi:tetratricopeptide (TPR) repeat protein
LSEAFSAERLEQLSERWRRDPSSSIFLPLAEEYRRGGQLARAVEVLEQGLERQPSYVSALVALGRCRLELGEPDAAVAALERAVAQDPAQLVANKLLVEGYLATGQAAKARERLEFYRLFNDRGAEIDALERRIEHALAASRPQPPPLFELPPAPAPPLELTATPPGVQGRPEAPFGRVHDPVEAERRLARAFGGSALFPLAVASAPPAAMAPAPLEPLSIEPAPAVPPWGGAGLSAMALEAQSEIVAEPFSPRTIGEEVERETIEEPFDEVIEHGAAASALPLEGERLPAPPAAETAPEPPRPFADLALLEPEPASAPVLPPATAPPVPSATLGELYLHQGHLEDAEAEFRGVLELRPDDPTARAGLAEIADRRRPPAAPAAPAVPPAGGLTRRKIETLRAYLDRLRRARRVAVVP